MLTMAQAHAGIVIGGTRVIYPASESEVTLKLSNEGNEPALVQTWTDKGDPALRPAEQGAPFLVTPPMARVEPKKAQTLRIVYTGEPLPRERESVFWLNVLEVPPKPGADTADMNKLQLAFRSRIKLFYRPAELKGRSIEAPAAVTWGLDSQQGELHLEAHNPTEYYVTFTAIDVHNATAQASFDEGVMIAPGETRRLPLKGTLTAADASVKVRYEAINDYGGVMPGETTLQQGKR